MFPFDILKKLCPCKGYRRVAVFVDGPNLLRKEFGTDLNKVREKIEVHGRIREFKVFLNQYAPGKLVEAISNEGYEPVVGVGEKEGEESDVDVYIACEAMKAVLDPRVDVIALVTRDMDFLPVILAAKKAGKETLVVGRNPGFSKALQHAADHVIRLDEF